MNEYCVYKHTSPSGKVYIGITMQAPDRRWGKDGGGYSHQRYLSQAILKYGWGNFQHEVLFSGLTREEACEKEVELIALYKSNQRDHGYNIDGGGICKIVTDETRKRLSESHKGKKLSEEQKQKISAANKGRVTHNQGKRLSEYHRQRISQGLMGRVVTAETREKLRAKNVGKKMSVESRLKMSESHRGLRPTAETVAKWKSSNKALMTPVEQIEKEANVVVAHFDSTMGAFRATGIDPSSISACCRGRRKSAGGFKWHYAVRE